MVSLWTVWTLIALIFVLFTFEHCSFLSKIKKSIYPRKSNILDVETAKIQELITIYEPYSDTELIKTEAIIGSFRVDSNAFEKIVDAFFKLVIGIAITFFTSAITISTGLINLIKDKVTKEVLIEQINEAIKLSDKTANAYGLILQIAAVIFMTIFLFFIFHYKRQSLINKHLAAIDVSKKINALN